MADTKYGHLVKKLNFQKDPSGSLVSLKGNDLDGLNLSFARYYPTLAGAQIPGVTSLHTHPYNECLVYAGLDYNHPNDLGAEIEVSLGEDREKYHIDAPTVVVVPTGLPHNPVVTSKYNKPYGGLIISLSGEHLAVNLPEKNTPPPASSKYQHLVKKLELKDMQRKSGGNADYIAGWNGKGLEGFNLNFTWAFHKGTGTWHKRDPHVHPYDEILLFVGCDPTNPEYLGAEIEIAMGEEQEKHIFDTSTVIVAPGGLVHCPLNTRSVDNPYCFSAICLNTDHETNWLGKDTGIGL